MTQWLIEIAIKRWKVKTGMHLMSETRMMCTQTRWIWQQWRWMQQIAKIKRLRMMQNCRVLLKRRLNLGEVSRNAGSSRMMIVMRVRRVV